MIQDVQSRIVKVRNELKAQKVASELAYSAMLWPDNAPTATYNGTIDLNNFTDPAARVAITFTRSDGADSTPYVDLAVDTDIFGFYEWVLSIGGTVSGRDYACEENSLFAIYADSTTNNSVTFYVDINQNVYSLSGYRSTTTFSINASAISPVAGTLSVTRVI